MIGFYNYTVILTYMSLISSSLGMIFAVNYRFKLALLCLALSGLFDDEKSFGIQLDSLCDAICFGAFPILLSYLMGLQGPFGIAILLFYITAGVIRLGYFNVMEIKRQEETSENRKYYSGLPITSISVILPLVSMLTGLVDYNYFPAVLHFTMLATGILFIVNFKMPKPKNTTLGILIAIVAISLLKIFHVF